MSGMTNRRFKNRVFSAAIVFILFIASISSDLFGSANALDFGDRSISISTSFAGDPVEHNFTFVKLGSSTIGSIAFEYCTNSPVIDVACTAPTGGFDASGFSIAAQSGMTGFTESGASGPNTLIITRAPALEGVVTASYTLNNFLNPPIPGITYVRIVAYDGIDGTGSVVDNGSVVFVTEQRYDVQAYVPPYLTFCIGVTVALDCSTATGFLADFGEFSPTNATAVTTQFSAATNDPTGYNTFINGQTMTSGTHIIPALPVQTASVPGISQFGINLRSNTSPSVGANPVNGAVASGAPDPNYGTPNLFRFVDGDRIAGSTVTTGFNNYTVSYVVNIADSQAPGLYAATFIYTSVASF